MRIPDVATPVGSEPSCEAAALAWAADGVGPAAMMEVPLGPATDPELEPFCTRVVVEELEASFPDAV